MMYHPMAGLPVLQFDEWTGELGHEPDLNMFIGHLVLCFRELRRVLRDDGVLFVNLGDSYVGNGASGTDKSSTLDGRKNSVSMATRSLKRSKVLPDKNKVGIPWRFALAMQADGWIWRDEIIWAKTSPMPGSQTDRCTVSHEPVLMFSKQKRYYYDIVAISEPSKYPNDNRKARAKKHHKSEPTAEKAGIREGDQTYETRYPRSVWTLSTEPSKENHFAAWPSKLARRMIQAGTSEHGCCAACGAPFKRIVEKERKPTRPGTASKLKNLGGWASGPGAHDTIDHNTVNGRKGNMRRLHDNYQRTGGKAIDPTEAGNRDPQRHTTQTKTIGWQATCECNAGISPCRVLDPFGGTGKTALAAERLHRDCTLIELKPQYAQDAAKHLETLRRKEAGMFA